MARPSSYVSCLFRRRVLRLFVFARFVKKKKKKKNGIDSVREN